MSVSGVGSDNPVTITFDKYQLGDAPVRIENWCEDVHLRLHQKGSNQVSRASDEKELIPCLYLLLYYQGRSWCYLSAYATL